MKFKWKSADGQFESGENLYAGPFKIGNVCYNPNRSKWDGPDNAYRGTINLPGIRIKQPHDVGATPEICKEVVEKIAESWFSRAANTDLLPE